MALNVSSSAGSNSIYVGQTGSSVVLDVNGQSRSFSNVGALTVQGNSGSDEIVIARTVTTKVTIFADSGADLLVTGSSNDTLIAGSGRCNLIALGGRNNLLEAGSGYDNLWYTAGNTIKKGSGTAVTHAIGGFINTSDTSLNGATFAEPAVDTQIKDTAGWVNVTAMGYPLFSSAGPSMNDLSQGEAGTCYFLSSCGSVAMKDPQHIRNIITPLGDGTYAEQFVDTSNGKTYFVRVDGYLPVSEAAWQQGELQLEYEHLGVGGSTWISLEEKGWAYFRAYEQGKSASYGIAEGGTGQEGLMALGATNLLYTNNPSGVFANGDQMLAWIDQELSSGEAVDVGILNAVSGQLEDKHEYSAVQVVRSSNGTIEGIWLHNPWGVDTSNGIAAAGHNDGANDGYVFITPATFAYAADNLAAGVV
jgi:hypothetical protein